MSEDALADEIRHAVEAPSTRIVVVGGGVAGLVVARECARPGFAVTLLEASGRVGGSVAPLELDGLTLDAGAESFATRGGHVAALLESLGLSDDVVQPNAAGAWVRHGSRSVPLPKAGLLGIPSSPLARDVVAAIGRRGAFRAYLDRLKPVLKIGQEKRLGALVRQRMGDKVLDLLVAPVVTGVYSASPDDLDVDVVAPGLNAALTRLGSLSGAVGELRSTAKAGSAVGHRGPATPDDAFARSFNSLGQLALQGVQVSARATDLSTGAVLFSVDDHVVMPTASIGKVLLLVEVAARLESGQLSPLVQLDRLPQDAAGDSGIWQHLQVPALPVADLAALVGASSDNLATNVLLRRVGLEAVSARTEALGLTRTGLLDLARDHRGPDDAPQLSVGSANELTWLFSALARGEVVDAATSQRVISWLSLNSDFSLVSSAFGLDPHSHRHAEHGILLVNKTGIDAGVRSEVGVLRGPNAGVTYAVSTYFDDTELPERLAVIEGMRTVGIDLLEYVF